VGKGGIASGLELRGGGDEVDGRGPHVRGREERRRHGEEGTSLGGKRIPAWRQGHVGRLGQAREAAANGRGVGQRGGQGRYPGEVRIGFKF
jgi:hypothetical protein